MKGDDGSLHEKAPDIPCSSRGVEDSEGRGHHASLVPGWFNELQFLDNFCI